MDVLTDLRIRQLEVALLAAAAAIGGGVASKLWYEIPIPDLQGLSPRDLVHLDRAVDVFEYLASLEVYVPASYPKRRANV